MDEAAYRQALTSAFPRNCPFEKSILTHCAACSMAAKHNIAEREFVACSDAAAHQRCNELRDRFRRSFAFALGKAHTEGQLPHAQEMRIQCGGLKGLQFVLDRNAEVSDVVALIEKAQQRFGNLADLPFSQIVQHANDLYKRR